jgi:hypothetical protein
MIIVVAQSLAQVKSSKPSPLISPALETERLLELSADSPLITKPPVPVAITGNGGMDVFNAGVGDDTIIINASNITALEQIGTGNRARVDGGVINGVFWLITQFW